MLRHANRPNLLLGVMLILGCGDRGSDGADHGAFEVEAQRSMALGRSSFAPGDVLGTPVEIHHGGPPERSINLIFAGEGFTEAEMDEFRLEVAFNVEGMFGGPSAVVRVGQTVVDPLPAVEEYRGIQDRINIWRVDIRSRESGLSDPTRGITRDTAFDYSLSGEIWGQLSYTGKTIEARRIVQDMVNADVVIIIANGNFRASAIPGEVTLQRSRLTPGTMLSQWRTLAHELGHALFLLQDEYTQGLDCEPMVPAPYASANVAFSIDPGQVPWADMISAGTPIPTPKTPAYTYTVGAFEGALFCDTGRWRPTQDCMMRNHRTQSFCPVCRREINRRVARLGPVPPPLTRHAPPSLRIVTDP